MTKEDKEKLSYNSYVKVGEKIFRPDPEGGTIGAAQLRQVNSSSSKPTTTTTLNNNNLHCRPKRIKAQQLP